MVVNKDKDLTLMIMIKSIKIGNSINLNLQQE